ncbi:MAG: arsenite methyltransferase [Gemmatimonadetes bacterium]|nr:arsenite methyltransferase [Gemmatimonadota bacterium]
MSTYAPETITQIVTEKYGAAARRVRSGEGLPADCCTSTNCCSGSAAASCDPISSNLYATGQTDELPPKAVLASLGCGNPTALAELTAGQVVLDLGSGGGIDVLLSARRVGPTGKAYGVDMTDDMLALARENAAEAGVTNVEFLKGRIEAVPLPDASVDVIISNCVVNLSADKPKVFAEAMRVLKPGGRLAISDVVVNGDAPAAVRENLALWAGCVAGAMSETDLRTQLAAAGFTHVEIEPTRVYDASDAREMLAGTDVACIESLATQMDGQVFSAFIRAVKPASLPVAKAPCCAPGCCA